MKCFVFQQMKVCILNYSNGSEWKSFVNWEDLNWEKRKKGIAKLSYIVKLYFHNIWQKNFIIYETLFSQYMKKLFHKHEKSFSAAKKKPENVIVWFSGLWCNIFYFCQISQAANAWRSSISKPFLTTAPCSFPFFIKRVSSGLYSKS